MTLTTRQGPKPRTTPTNPHTQLDQNPTPSFFEYFKESAFARFPEVSRRPSMISVPGAEALCWCGKHRGPHEAFMYGDEFAHIHPAYDGSLHLALPENVCTAVIHANWGEVHPVAKMGFIPSTVMMVYAPRNEAELNTVLDLLNISFLFAAGQYLET